MPTADRAAVGVMLAGLGGAIDVIVPRGGKSLVARVQEEARVPVFAHLEGLCHTYVHAAADLDMARAIVVNAKMRRTGVCGATETLLVDRGRCADASGAAGRCADRGRLRGARRRGGAGGRSAASKPATEDDWATEYLDAIIAVKVVDGARRGDRPYRAATARSTPTAIVDRTTQAAAERFLARVDSAIVLHNASTQFADGGEFGMGAEIGIATGSCTRAGRSASSSSRPSSMSCAAPGRLGLEAGSQDGTEIGTAAACGTAHAHRAARRIVQSAARGA